MKVLYSLGESGKTFGEIGKRPKGKRTIFILPVWGWRRDCEIFEELLAVDGFLKR